MLRGLYTAVSGMQTTQKKVDVISNNIANVNTTGFKKDVVVTESFPEVLIKKMNGNLRPEPYSRYISVDVDRDGQAINITTESGYFVSEGPMGKSYSSSSSFTIDEEGFLRTFVRDNGGEIDASKGNYILDSNGARIQVDDNNIDINNRGQVLVNGQEAADLLYRPGFDVIGTLNSGLGLNRVQTYFTQGSPEETNNTLDIAIDGQGFFKVATPLGEMYTRNGNFTLNDNGEIVTKEGYFLLGELGSIILDEEFSLQNFQIAEDGAIILNGEFIDQIDIVNISNLKDLRKYGEGFYQFAEGSEIQAQDFRGKVLQGFLETSNINPIDEMVDMITSLRLYESNQKVVQAYDEILQKAVNDIGRV